MSSGDGVIYNRSFDMIHTIDDKLKDPNLKLKFGDNEFSLAEINNLIPSKEKKLDIFVEWDNMCQYSIFGAISILEQLLEIDIPIDIMHFFKREKYPNGLDYLKFHLLKDVDPNLIDKAIEKYYTEIMSKSLTTDFFNRMDLMKFMLNSVTFMFRYNSDQYDSFVKEISATKFNNEVDCRYVILKTEESEKEYIKNTISLKELYIVPDMGLYYQTMINYDKNNTTILSYPNHCGMSPYILAYYYNEFIYNGLEGPNDITLSFLKELTDTKGDTDGS